MPTRDIDERRLAGAALSLLGLAMGALGAAAAARALDHMAVAQTLCGPAVAHCVWCPTALVALTAALAATAAGGRLMRREAAPLLL